MGPATEKDQRQNLLSLWHSITAVGDLHMQKVDTDGWQRRRPVCSRLQGIE